ncbi:helix-turn-helix transcriptional regulator [Nonomuraea sp. B12E4]|uniref:helix-turn-helix domain-containing protein n=1 Tax=Nonomuraea sp. B12E4 TaxID=3153564 RepID=UPI00325C8D96
MAELCHTGMVDPKAVLAARVMSRRLELGLSIDRAAEVAGMSATTWARVEHAKQVQALTYAAIERVLGWESGGCRQVMNDGAPTLATPPAAAPTPQATTATKRYPDNPVLQHLWDTPDPSLTDEDREALIQVYRALKRTSAAAASPARLRDSTATAYT